MPKISAGLLVYRRREGQLELFLVHMGGPFWARKDEGAWTIPKGELGEGEEALQAAKREFSEETGFAPPDGAYDQLEPIRQSGSKVVQAFAVKGTLDAAAIQSNTFELEWPPRSGKTQSFPEADKAAWFGKAAALKKVIKGQRALIEQFYGRFS